MKPFTPVWLRKQCVQVRQRVKVCEKQRKPTMILCRLEIDEATAATDHRWMVSRLHRNPTEEEEKGGRPVAPRAAGIEILIT